ncbi:hypothetical protein AVEN_65217-1 [Araneus ventricosus]|uniref:Uncharacterized protein n=1 Tax=Araneus ventricosus TaxID=182803 RepID=A0A4Y2AFS0_ARAVE|nr:hypothetical protein AVEN_65217-1 [Araneus ventricosus]
MAEFTEPPLKVADLPLNFVLHFLNLPFNFALHFLDPHLNFSLYFIDLPLDLALYFVNHSFHFLFSFLHSLLSGLHLFLSSLHLCHHGKQLFTLFIHRSGQRSGLWHSQENQNIPLLTPNGTKLSCGYM